MEIKNKELVELLKKRQEIVESGYPLYDQIEKIATKAIKNNMSKIAADVEAWKYLKPYIDEKEYKKCNDEMGKVYRKLQKLEYDMTRIKDKVMAKVAKEDIKLKEFEEISSIKLDGNKAMVEIIDKIESYKQMLRDKQNEN